MIGGALNLSERVGQRTAQGIETCGHWGSLVGESIFWLFAGPRLGQPVRTASVATQMMEVGISAIPIVTLLSATIGMMLAIQGIHTLATFGAEERVVVGISLSVVREFSALITGILVAGRSGSALAARLSTMQINAEIDALRVMGINPVRFLVAPALFAMLIIVPALTFLSDLVALFAAGLFVSFDLGLSMAAYWSQTIEILSIDDLWHGLGKSVIFAVLITLIGVANGASVSGGAEGVGRVTTRAVVQSIAAIVITDMLFAFIATR